MSTEDKNESKSKEESSSSPADSHTPPAQKEENTPRPSGREALEEAIEFYLNQPEEDFETTASPDRDVDDILRLMAEVPSTHRDSPDAEALIGPYRLIKELGCGGQGTVYLAEDERLGRKVALKVLGEQASFSAAARLRLRREAEATGKLHHPGICPVYEFGESGGQVFMAMSYIPGITLAQHIAQERGDIQQSEFHDFSESGTVNQQVPTTPTPGPDALRAALRYIMKAALALHAAHEAGLIHRDIKPGNIMLTPEGEPIILDFGLSRQDDRAGPDLTMTGQIIGTPAYMSPEQVRVENTKIDRRSDVYSMGVTLYELITLKRPFNCPTREALYRAILSEVPLTPDRLNPSISRDLRVVVETAIDKDQDRRYQTAADLAEDIRRILDKEPIMARPAGPLLRLRRWTARNPRVAALTTLLFVVLSAGSAIFSYLYKERNTALNHSTEYSRELEETATMLKEKSTILEKSFAVLQEKAALEEAQKVAYLGLSVAENSPQQTLYLGLASYDLKPNEVAMKTLQEGLRRSSLHMSFPEDRYVVGIVPGDELCVLACYYQDNHFEIWSLKTKERLSVLKTGLDGSWSEEASFSPNGQFMCLMGESPQRPEVWDLQSRNLVPTSPVFEVPEEDCFQISQGSESIVWMRKGSDVQYLDWQPQPQWRAIHGLEVKKDNDILAVIPSRGNRDVCVITSGEESIQFFDSHTGKKTKAISVADWAWADRPEGRQRVELVNDWDDKNALLSVSESNLGDGVPCERHLVLDLSSLKVLWADTTPVDILTEITEPSLVAGMQVLNSQCSGILLPQENAFLRVLRKPNDGTSRSEYAQIEKWDYISNRRLNLKRILSDAPALGDISKLTLTHAGLTLLSKDSLDLKTAIFDDKLRLLRRINGADISAWGQTGKRYLWGQPTNGDNYCTGNNGIFRTQSASWGLQAWGNNDYPFLRSGHRITFPDSRIEVLSLEDGKPVFALDNCREIGVNSWNNLAWVERDTGVIELWNLVRGVKMGTGFFTSSSLPSNFNATADQRFVLTRLTPGDESPVVIIVRLKDGKIIESIPSPNIAFFCHSTNSSAVIQKDTKTLAVWQRDKLQSLSLPDGLEGNLLGLAGVSPTALIQDSEGALHFIGLDGKAVRQPTLPMYLGKSPANVVSQCSFHGPQSMESLLKIMARVIQDLSDPKLNEARLIFVSEDGMLRAWTYSNELGRKWTDVRGPDGLVNRVDGWSAPIQYQDQWALVTPSAYSRGGASSVWPMDAVEEARNQLHLFPGFGFDSDTGLLTDALMSTPHCKRLAKLFEQEDEKAKLINRLEALRGEVPDYLLNAAMKEATHLNALKRIVDRAFAASDDLDTEEDLQRTTELLELADEFLNRSETLSGYDRPDLELTRLRLLWHHKDLMAMVRICGKYIHEELPLLSYFTTEHLGLIISPLLKMDQVDDAKRILDRLEADRKSSRAWKNAIKAARETIKEYEMESRG